MCKEESRFGGVKNLARALTFFSMFTVDTASVGRYGYSAAMSVRGEMPNILGAILFCMSRSSNMGYFAFLILRS